MEKEITVTRYEDIIEAAKADVFSEQELRNLIHVLQNIHKNSIRGSIIGATVGDTLLMEGNKRDGNMAKVTLIKINKVKCIVSLQEDFEGFEAGDELNAPFQMLHKVGQ